MSHRREMGLLFEAILVKTMDGYDGQGDLIGMLDSCLPEEVNNISEVRCYGHALE